MSLTSLSSIVIILKFYTDTECNVKYIDSTNASSL